MLRRSRGSGSVRFNAARGRYEAVLVVGGTKHTRTVPSPEPNERRKREAERVLSKLAAQYGTKDPRGLTVEGFLEEWLIHMEPPRVAWLTWRTHKSRVDRHLIPAFRKLPIEGLTTRRIDGLLARLARDYSPITVQHVRKTLHAAMAQAEVWELIPRNPVALVKAPRTPNVERRTLDGDQALAFLEHVRGDRLEALWYIAACLGLRSGEVRGLTWECVDGDTLRIEQALGYQPGQWDLHQPKTPKSRRTLTLPPFLAELLGHRREAQRFEAAGIGYANPMGLVFTQPDGYPLSSQWLNVRLAALLASAGLPRVTVHDLRHLAASVLLAHGVPVRAVQDILGHATARMTLEVYASSDDTQRKAAAASITTWLAR